MCPIWASVVGWSVFRIWYSIVPFPRSIFVCLFLSSGYPIIMGPNMFWQISALIIIAGPVFRCNCMVVSPSMLSLVLLHDDAAVVVGSSMDSWGCCPCAIKNSLCWIFDSDAPVSMSHF